MTAVLDYLPPMPEIGRPAVSRERAIGSVADFHYSFMGAAPIRKIEAKARELAGLLKKDRVDAVLLCPV